MKDIDQKLREQGMCGKEMYDQAYRTFSPCRRKSKDGGLCGLHAAAERRAAEKLEKEREERQRSTTADLRASDLADKLADAYGLDRTQLKPHYDWRTGTYTGGLVFSPAAVEALLRAL